MPRTATTASSKGTASCIGEAGDREGVKLENEYLVTADGVENLTPYPFDDRLLGEQARRARHPGGSGAK